MDTIWMWVGFNLFVLVLLALFRLTGRPLDRARMLWIGRLLAVLVIIAGYLVFVENAHRWYRYESRAAELEPHSGPIVREAEAFRKALAAKQKTRRPQ